MSRVWRDDDDEYDGPIVDLLWGLFFLTIGGAIMISLPPVHSGWALLIGVSSCLVGLVGVCRFILTTMERNDW